MDVVVEGWIDKPKGVFQILFKRGFIDPSKPPNYYSMEGKKDEFGHVIESTSLNFLKTKLIDFEEEETLLQYHGRLLGVIVDRSPKCHPEVAGEGIEYDWGCAKNYYRRLPMSKKRGKEIFRRSVRDATSRDNILTLKRRRKFSRRARQYMLAYVAIDACKKQQQGADVAIAAPVLKAEVVKQEAQDTTTVNHFLIEKVVKKYKTHRSMLDCDTKFVRDIVSTMFSSSSSNKTFAEAEL